MKFQPNRIALAASLSLLGAVAAAQTAPAAAPDAKDKAATAQLSTVVVTGIRASLEASIKVKREADTNVEVVTAEDVGKMPDKNIADALSRLPGVNVQFGGALAMDEAERVAIRGTSPNLNLVTINSHALSSGDWHVGDQSGSGRSVGFGLMPSQLIGQSIVYKTQRADITEGGIAGTVDILTRKPLDFRKSLSAEVAVGGVYATLPNKTDPQLSGLIAWKNEDNTLGVMLQAFKENRHLRRDGQEVFGYGVLSVAQATAAGDATLAGKRMPGSLNSALFEGVRERSGGYLGVQFRPTKDLDINLSAFRADLKADNYNSSGFALPTALLTGNAATSWQIKNAKVQGDVITAASLERPAPTAATANQRIGGFEFDHNVRQGAKSLSSFYDLDAKFKANDNLIFSARAGYTKGSGVTNSQPSLTFVQVNPNIAYNINTSRPTDYGLTDPLTGKPIDLSTPKTYTQVSNTGASVNSTDTENYLHLDAEFKLNGDVFTSFKAGLRSAGHKRTYAVLGARWNAQDTTGGPVSPSPFVALSNFSAVNKDNLPVYPGTVLPTTANIVPSGTLAAPATAYPANWGSGLDANFPRALFRYNPAQIQAFASQYVNWNPVENKIYTSGYQVDEANLALYAMTEFELTPALTGNAGLRLATTEVTSLAYQALPSGTGTGQCVALQPCAVAGAIVGSRFATYLPQTVKTADSTFLPSLNLRWALDSKLIARFAASRSLGRPNYNELAGAVSLNDTLLTGSSGNPNLQPIKATNLDASLAWYFAPRAYASVAVFNQQLQNYVKVGISKVDFFNIARQAMATYDVTSRIGVKARLRGAEAALEMPVGGGFGIGVNATYVDGKDQDGVMLLGTSKTTYNLRGFYEDDKLSASLAWNARSDYGIGFVGNGAATPSVNAAGVVTQVNGLHMYKGSGSLSASIGYRFSEQLSIHLDGNNLLDPVRHTYFVTENAPAYWHQSGRQYFLNLRMKY